MIPIYSQLEGCLLTWSALGPDGSGGVGRIPSVGAEQLVLVLVVPVVLVSRASHPDLDAEVRIVLEYHARHASADRRKKREWLE